jgi:hypothetical protein
MTASHLDPRAIQRALNDKGFGLKEDGALGPRTQAAMTRAVWDVVGSKSTLWPPAALSLAPRARTVVSRSPRKRAGASTSRTAQAARDCSAFAM